MRPGPSSLLRALQAQRALPYRPRLNNRLSRAIRIAQDTQRRKARKDT